jgi:hypothetical protein
LSALEKVRGSSSHIVYRNAAGTQLPGATTIVSCIGNEGKTNGLMYWAAGLAKQGIDHGKYRDGLATVGTCAHVLIQADLQGFLPELSDFAPSEVLLARRALNRYQQWRAQKDIKVLGVEMPLVSELFQYGGTLDLYVELDGRPGLIDIKTAKAIYDTHWAQVAGYRQLLRENDYPVEFTAILQAGRTEAESFMFKVETEERMDLYWEQFAGALRIYHAQQRLKYA